MADSITTEFQEYALSLTEQVEGAKLTITQAQLIHNLRTAAARELLTLVPDPDSFNDYLKRQSYTRGMLDAYTHLLEASIAANSEVNYLYNN